MKQFFVTGIGTEVGKTVISAILTEALQADYWKPVQAGDLDNTDSMKVAAWVSNKRTKIHPETHRLNTPASPHYAAELDNIRIDLKDFVLPKTTNNLIVEGAGGLMVPLNEQDLIIDLIKQLGLPVILVSRNYLGSINHTLLSIDALKQRNIPIEGIIFNGESTPATEQFILNYGGLKLLGRVGELEVVDEESVRKEAQSGVDFSR